MYGNKSYLKQHYISLVKETNLEENYKDIIITQRDVFISCFETTQQYDKY